MDREKFFINRFSNNHIGDDAAVVGNYLYSKDAFFEDVHFKRIWMSYYQIAYKSILVNISDAIAMGAKPLYALLSVSLPKYMNSHDLVELSRGFNEAVGAFDCQIIGGDTIKGEKLHITVTIISYTKHPLTRQGLQNGDLVAYTGKLGESKKGLDKLFKGVPLPKNHRFIRPVLRSEFIYQARKYLRCGMDISDGLYSDLDKMLERNNKGFKWLHRVPKSQGLSGEEYEMLIAFAPKHRAKILNLAKKRRLKLTIFAKIAPTKQKLKYRSHHF
ncbi:MAG: thiamine-phosphate kinase [Campylobacterota bacterium]